MGFELNVKPKTLDREDKRMPQTIPQLIQKYQLEALWPNIEKIVKEVVEQSIKDINADRIKTGTLSADRIHGGSLTLGGEDNVNGSLQVVNADSENVVNVTKDGIILGNDTILGENGLLSNLQFSQFKWTKIGYSTDYLSTNIGEYLYITIPIFIPENFEVVSAKVTLYHSPVKWAYNNTTVWGYCRNLKLYKKVDNTNYFQNVELSSENFPENELYSTEIENAFGENGFTGEVPSDNSHLCESITSIDIKSYLQSNTNTILQIRSGNTIPALNPDIGSLYQTNYLNQTANVKAKVDIVGFMK